MTTQLWKLTWPEVNEVVRQQKIVLIPVGAIEQHGPHLPIDVDVLLPTTVCERAAAAAPDLFVTAYGIPYGYNEHNMEFPGTVDIAWDHFVNFCSDVAMSYAHMGFRHILFVNGHGSNANLLETAARLVTMRSKSMCAAVNWWSLAAEEIRNVRESEMPGGMSHACELETSLYLHISPGDVRREEIRKEIWNSESRFFKWDLMAQSPVRLVNRRSATSHSGVRGDPTLATADKGERIASAAVATLVEIGRDFQRLKEELLPPVSYIVESN